jgi:PIN domain nuclease of toxin-antitoxin system
VIDRLLLDTHIVLWLDSGDKRLAVSTRDLIDRCWGDGGTVLVSAVSIWEIAMLLDTGRIELDVAIKQWIERFLAQPGTAVIPLDYRAAARSYQLRELEHRDPADRLLIATAIDLQCPLVTYDGRIAAFAQRHGGNCGFTVAA